MDKNKLSFFFDALMFLTIMALAGVGLLMKYILIPGRLAWVKYARRMELTWLGLDRHAWEAVHLYLTFLLVALLALHVILRREKIFALLAGFMADSPLRKGIIPAFFLLALALLAFPLLVPPEINEVGLRENRSLGTPSAAAGSPLATAPVNGREPAKTDLSPQSGPSDPGSQAIMQSKSGQKKINSSVWPKKPYDQADYRRHHLTRQGHRTAPLLAYGRPPTNPQPTQLTPNGMPF